MKNIIYILVDDGYLIGVEDITEAIHMLSSNINNIISILNIEKSYEGQTIIALEENTVVDYCNRIDFWRPGVSESFLKYTPAAFLGNEEAKQYVYKCLKSYEERRQEYLINLREK